ncbi:hypothetical protein TNCV_1599291 [Trichonephila clavipes]|nr:hypothetical protein TNCV_1599291 [Trichonephila clavipes]
MGRRRGKEQKKQHINPAENILLNGYSTTGIPNSEQKSSGKSDSYAVWDFGHSERFLQEVLRSMVLNGSCREDTWHARDLTERAVVIGVKSLVYADKPKNLDHLEDNIRRVIAEYTAITRPIYGHKCWKKSSKIGRPDWTRASRGCPMPEIIFKM